MVMKKIKCFCYLLFFAFVAFATTSCNSDELQSSEEFDVSFVISNVTNSPSSVSSDNGMSKVKVPDSVKCNDLKAHYVIIVIDGTEKKIPVFYIGNVAWTNTVRLTPGVHEITEFLVYSENDTLISAVPHAGKPFARYVKVPLNQKFTVASDKKNEIKLEVVCYEEKYFTDFGFVYFKFNEIRVRKLWFFANFCIKNKADYAESLYAQQSGWESASGPFIDVPAIMKVEVWKNGAPIDTFKNSVQGEKFFVKYVDYLGQTDNFELKLYILVRQGTAFDYVLFKSWMFNDISDIPEGSDKVIDGVLGNCYDPINPPDFILDQCYVNETAWSVGPKYKETGNWATYTPYNGVYNKVDLLAGQTLSAGTVEFSAPVSGEVTITITLASGWSLQNGNESVKIQGYTSAPTESPSPGQFDTYKGTSLVIQVPQYAFYGVHVDVRKQREVPCPE